MTSATSSPPTPSTMDSSLLPAHAGAELVEVRKDDLVISRRRLMAWVSGGVAAQVFSAPFAFAISGESVVQRSASPKASWRPEFFSRNQALTVARLAEVIIPRTDTAGAIDAKVPEYIDLTLSLESKPKQTRFLQRLKELEKMSKTAYRGSLRKISDAQLQELLLQISDQHEEHDEATRPAALLFKDLKDRTVFGYYTSLEGRTQELGLPGRVQRVDIEGCGPSEAESSPGSDA